MEDEQPEAVDARSIYIGNVSFSDAFLLLSNCGPASSIVGTKLTTSVTGRLRCNPRGDPGALPGLRHDQPGDDSVRQVYGTSKGVGSQRLIGCRAYSWPKRRVG
jgi:hypothetical protein